MQEQVGINYSTAKHAKALCVAPPKDGKTVLLVSQILGVFPGQQFGGIVDKPEHLHIMTFDQGALSGVTRFLTESCKAPKEACNYRVYNFQDDVRRVAQEEEDYAFSLYNGVIGTLDKIMNRARTEGGVHALLVSSLTKLVEAIQRELFGPPAKRDAHEDERSRKLSKGQADFAKWGKFKQMVSELRDFAQVDDLHTLWEGHITVSGEGDTAKESLAIQGSSAQTFTINTEQILRLRRLYNQKIQGYNVDQAYFDAQPSLEFVANGRSFNEAKLTNKEPDLTAVFGKLGFRLGQWGLKKA